MKKNDYYPLKMSYSAVYTQHTLSNPTERTKFVQLVKSYKVGLNHNFLPPLHELSGYFSSDSFE